jgi:hypothetical protein
MLSSICGAAGWIRGWARGIISIRRGSTGRGEIGGREGSRWGVRELGERVRGVGDGGRG